MSADAPTLRRELIEAFKGRAHMYRLVLEVLTERHGAEDAQAALGEACHRRGVEVAPLLFKDCPPEPEAVGRRFLSFSPDGGDLYPHDAEATQDAFKIRVHACPLKQAWIEAGLPPEGVARLCQIAGEFDRGLFEAAGVGFSNSTWSEARPEGCCHITLTQK
ncbi:MAG: L-2-amino-thiazoline-4-carboxylic acid hydrolase [Beijerinckiaceae bacterium]